MSTRRSTKSAFVSLVGTFLLFLSFDAYRMGWAQDMHESESELLSKIAIPGSLGDPREAFLVRWETAVNLGYTGDLSQTTNTHVAREAARINRVFPFDLQAEREQSVDILLVFDPDIISAAKGKYKQYFNAGYSSAEKAAAGAERLGDRDSKCFTNLLLSGQEIGRAVSFISTELPKKQLQHCISISMLKSFGVGVPNTELSVLNSALEGDVIQLTEWDLRAVAALYAYQGDLVLKAKD